MRVIILLLILFYGCGRYNEFKSAKPIYFKPLKIYEFDYMLGFEYKDNNQSISKSKTYLTNSKSSDYFLKVSDSVDNYILELRHHDNLKAFFKLRKDSFKESQNINLNCNLIKGQRYGYYNQTNNYSFLIENDTLINDKYYKQYVIKRTEKRDKLKAGTIHYIVERNSDFHSPIFFHFTAYNEYKSTNTIPKGVVKNRYVIDYKGDKTDVYNLKYIRPFKFIISINEDCLLVK